MVLSKHHVDDADGNDDWQEYLREREKAIRRAKRKARSDLNPYGGDWEKWGYAESNILDVSKVRDTTPRIPVSSLTREQWLEKYEKTRTPVILTGITKGWKANTAWTVENLNATYANTLFKVGEDDSGSNIRLSMRHFLEYCQDPKHAGLDDSPLYIFDSNFEHPSIRRMLGDYEIPAFFKEDLLQYVAEDIRPMYRWVVIGPARSGTWLHLDPLYTSAWNTLISGTKRWILFPPRTPKHVVSPDLKEDQEAVSWFKHVYPQTQKPSWPYDKPIEIIQRAGETIYVPGGWWHAVLNLDMTVAVTQNYANSVNFPYVWTHAVRGRPYMSQKWLAALRVHRPDMAAIADYIQKNGCADCETEIDDDDEPEPPSADYEDNDDKRKEQQQSYKHKRHPPALHDDDDDEDEDDDEEPEHHYHRRQYDEDDEEEEEEKHHRRRRYVEHGGEEVGHAHAPTGRRMKLPDAEQHVNGHQGARVLSGLEHGRGARPQLHQAGVGAIAGGQDLSGKHAFLLSHGTLMLGAWILIFPLAVLLARHKWVLGDRRLRWMHGVWHLLRVIQVLGFLTMVAGLVIALVALDAPESQTGKLHFFIGAVVFALTSLRVLGNPGPKSDSPSRLLRDRVHNWLWHLLPAAGFANVLIGITLLHEMSHGYYSYSMWVVPMCMIAGAMLLVEIMLGNMKRVRGVREQSYKVAGYPQEGKVGRGQNLASNELHFRSMRHGMVNGLDVN